MAVYKSNDQWRVKPWCADVYKDSTRVRGSLLLKQRQRKKKINEWEYVGLDNPFAGLKLGGSQYNRTRRLQDREYERPLDACKKCRGHNMV